MKELVRQQGLLFGGRHFRKYRFLITLSDQGAGEGLEHSESSEDGTGLRAGVNGTWGELLAHEMTHSWNGKFRRPEGLATPDFHKPMDGGGLWVYEGLTQYLGYVQAARSGFTSPERWRGIWANLARGFDNEPGRAWRPVIDTARSVGLLRGAGGPWAADRRGTEYYTEGALVWMEADCIIREGTGGKKSLDDFVKIFYGGITDAPEVRPYGTAEIVKDLKEVYAYDWAKYLHDRIDRVHLDTPDEALARAGFRLVLGAPVARPEGEAPPAGRPGRGGFGGTNLPALGLAVGRDGVVSSLAVDGPAPEGGPRPGRDDHEAGRQGLRRAGPRGEGGATRPRHGDPRDHARRDGRDPVRRRPVGCSSRGDPRQGGPSRRDRQATGLRLLLASGLHLAVGGP